MNDYLQRTKTNNLDDYEFIDGYAQATYQNIGKHHLLTPGTYIIGVETQILLESNIKNEDKEDLGKYL